ncbi:hypothetical protein BJ138DRAFT_1144995 [Hygrophoropsis aurantiaca]|uniref:Uncharacterized protein n=1 Tax=Hygrophoropsis aurantiaca TaxID=72124 RepID=A0ACB8ALM4_9AGAM|nr:hypothetical protein BJ138DRAFT_1144995 [Hygrophoropsis aurantiaca]
MTIDAPVNSKDIIGLDAIAPLDDTLYTIQPAAAALLKSITGIANDDLLKKHILTVQEKAYKIFPYPCIRTFTFLRLDISSSPAYEKVLQLARERKDAIMLDMGCCFGIDVRNVAAEGFPASNIVACDLNRKFWDLGHELFKSTPESFPAHFVEGDVFDPSILTASLPASVHSKTSSVKLSDLTSLNPLHGRVSVVHAQAFFHLFDEEKQLQLARSVAGLLSPEPGSVILGAHAGLREGKGMLSGVFFQARLSLFCHSPETWTAMWDGEVFDKGTVKVNAFSREFVNSENSINVLYWSVERI